MRSSHAGMYHAFRSSSHMTAGTSVPDEEGVDEYRRAERDAELLDRALRPGTNERKTTNMIAAAAITTRPMAPEALPPK